MAGFPSSEFSDLWLSLEAFPPDWLIVSLLSHLNHAVSGFSVVFRET